MNMRFSDNSTTGFSAIGYVSKSDTISPTLTTTVGAQHDSQLQMKEDHFNPQMNRERGNTKLVAGTSGRLLNTIASVCAPCDRYPVKPKNRVTRVV